MNRLSASVVVFGLVVGALVGYLAAQQVGPSTRLAQAGPPDLVLYNARIFTMDDASTASSPGRIVQAMAVRGGRVAALGTTGEMRALADSKTALVDAKGRTVVPGIVDTHAHPVRVHDRSLGQRRLPGDNGEDGSRRDLGEREDEDARAPEGRRR